MIIDKHFLAQYSPIPSNYDVANLLPYVSIAEKIWVIPIIGYDFYMELDEQVNAPSGGTLTPQNATLLTDGGLWQYLAFSTLLEALPFVWTRLTEAGIQLGKSDNSDSVSLKDLTLIQNHIRNQVEVQKEFVIKYLCSHTESFPLFDTSVCPDCGCGCNKNKGGLFSPNPKHSLYKPTKGCVSPTTVSSTSSSVDLSNYYTKSETDELIDNKIESAITSGIDLDNYWTSAQTEQAITQAISGKADASVVSALTEEVAANYYTKNETDAIISEQGDSHIDKLEVGQIDMTTHSSAGTCNINGVNKITASSGDIASLSSNTVNAASVNVQYMGSSKNVASWISQKLDASAYTPTDLSEYWTSAQTQSAITEATTNMQTTINMTQSITSGSTATQYPSASAVYDAIPKFQVNNGVLNIITV